MPVRFKSASDPIRERIGVLAKPFTARVVCRWGIPTMSAADYRRHLSLLPQCDLRLTEGWTGAGGAQSGLMRRRLLIVDDNRDFRRLARELLEAEGYEVVGAARDATEALTAAGELAPDAVLLDVNLPDASGFEVAARLVRERPSVAVVLTSTRGDRDFGQLALASGARGFVPKDDLTAANLDRLFG
jgi:CheY-like chemotaxis protein